MVAVRHAVFTLALMVVVCAAGSAVAQPKTWIGGHGDWEDAGNWNPPGEPGATSQVQVNAGAGEVSLGLERGGYHEAFSILTESAAEGQVEIERWTGDRARIEVHNGLLNLGNLELGNVDIIGDVVNHGHLQVWGVEVEVDGNLTNIAGAEMDLSPGTSLDVNDGTLLNDGTVNVYPWSVLSAGGITNNNTLAVSLSVCAAQDMGLTNTAGAVIEGTGAVHSETDISNAGLIRSTSGDLAVHTLVGTVTNTGTFQNTPGTSLHVTALSVNHTGRIIVNAQGAVTFTCDLANPAVAEIHLLGGTLSAPNITHQAGATFEGFGCVTLTGDGNSLGTLTNQSDIDLYADNQIVGDLDNQAAAVLGIRNGDLTIVGHTTNNGDINAVNAAVYFEGGYSGVGNVFLSGAEVKAVAGDMTVGAGGVVDVTGSGSTRFYADLHSGGTIEVGVGVGAVFYGDLKGSGTTQLLGGATASVVHVRQNALIIGEGGTLTVRAGQAEGTSVVKTLSIAGGATPTGKANLTDNSLIVDYAGGASSFGQVAAWIASGLHDGPSGYWDGPGIVSSVAAADPHRATALGVIDNSDTETGIGGLTTFAGETVSLKSVLVAYTWYGDANLDGVLDSNDYDRIDTNWARWTAEGIVPEGGFRWAVGDFTYDNMIDSNDYDLIDRAYGLSEGAPVGRGTPIPMPEPATLALLTAGGLLLLHRRRAG